MRAVFWVPAINRESFEQAYYEIAMLLCIPGIEDDKADIKQLVKAQLSDESFGQWLLVVDNADDARVLFDKLEEGKSDDRLIDFLPQSRQGSIIFTTRTRVVATELAENHVIALSELDKAGATEVLTRRLPQERQSELGEGDTVDEFLEMLSFHALAIVQAIAFVNANEISLSEYIALYKNSERDAMDLLSTDFVDQTRYREATNAVATTWYISFERIQTQDAIAAEHLFFMACTAHNDIDPAMFPQHYTPVQHVKAMGTLKAYSFVVERQPRAEGPYKRTRKPYKTFDVHPLIHVAISGWLKTHHQWIVWIEKVLARLISIIPYGNPSTKEYWGVCMHHAIHAANLSEAKELEGGMILLERIAKCLRSQGHNQSAERTYRQALEQRQKMSGKEHPDTLMTMGNVALTLQSQRRWTEAEIILQEVLILTKKVLGERHPQTITTIGNQSLLLLAQRKYVEAEEAFRESFLISKEVYGAKHQETLTSMGNLGTALLGQKKYPEAESLLRETLVLRKEVLGTPHLDIFSNMSTLGTTLINQHKYVEAESLHREELALRTEMLGLEHPGTIASMHGLGGALCGQHKFAETEQLQRDALALSRKVSGEEDPATLANMSAIAHTLSTQKKYADAEHMHRVTLALKEKVLGLQHPDTLTSVYWLATLKQQQLMYRDALPLHERAYAGFVEVLGKEHATTMECKGEYDWVTHMVGVERLEEEGRAGRETGRVIGSEDTTESREVWVVRVRNRWRVKMKKFGTKQA
jgi:tetratricopeptide (TPR) repeat protein